MWLVSEVRLRACVASTKKILLYISIVLSQLLMLPFKLQSQILAPLEAKRDDRELLGAGVIGVADAPVQDRRRLRTDRALNRRT